MATKHKKTIRPLGARVLVAPLDEHIEKTASGIIIPETADKERPQMGTVIAVGEGRTTDDGTVIPLEVTKGDTILFSKYGPDEITVEGEEYLIIAENTILAVIK